MSYLDQDPDTNEQRNALLTIAEVIALVVIGIAAALLVAIPSYGATQWTRTMTASTRYVTASSASADTAGNSYVGVTYAGIVDFGNGPVAAVSNATDAAVVSYDAAGTLRWVSRLTGPEFQAVYGVAAGDDGYIYVTGAYGGTMMLANTIAAVGSGDTFIAKIHAQSGSHVWVRSYGSVHDESGRAIAYRDGRICVAGLMYGAHSLGGPVLTPQSVDGWVGCYGAAEGAHVWSRLIGGAGADNSMAVAMDGAQSVYVGGRFYGALAVPPLALASAGGADAYLLKLHADGTALRLLGPLPSHLLDDAVTSVAVQSGRVAVTGWTQPGASRPTSIWMTQVTTDGAIETVGEWGSPIAVSALSSTANGVAINVAGDATLIGMTSAELQFGGPMLVGPYTNDVVSATFNGATYRTSSRQVAAGSQSGQAVALTAGGMVVAANDGNNVVVSLHGDGAPVPTGPVATNTPTTQATSSRTSVPTGTPTQSPTQTRTRTPVQTATLTVSPTHTGYGTPRPTPTLSPMPTCAKPTNAPCVVEG